MNRFILSLTLVSLVSHAFAEMQPPQRVLQPIKDPSMVVMDRGAKLEIFPTQRAVPTQTNKAEHAVIHLVRTVSADTPIGPKQLGVVFNHAMQQQGYISGEITFKMKPGRSVAVLSASLYPSLTKITNPDVYAVNTRTPAEFVRVLKRLQARHDLEWVEPTVTYGPGESTPTSR